MKSSKASVIPAIISSALMAIATLPAEAHDDTLRPGSWMVQIDSDQQSDVQRRDYCVAPAQAIESFARDLGFFFNACDKKVLTNRPQSYQVRTVCTQPFRLQLTQTFDRRDESTVDGRIDVNVDGHKSSSLVTARWVNSVCRDDDSSLKSREEKQTPPKPGGEPLHEECIEPPPLWPEIQPQFACEPQWLQKRKLLGEIDGIRLKAISSRSRPTRLESRD